MTGLRSGRARWGMAAVVTLASALGLSVMPAGARPDTRTHAGSQTSGGPSFEKHGPGPSRAAAGQGSAAAPLSTAAAATNLTYNTVDPCRTFDSRLAGGAFGSGEGFLLSFHAQSSPCPLPGDGSVKAVMANVISVNASGTGYVRAAAYDPNLTSPAVTVLNFNDKLVSSNAIPLPVCTTNLGACDWDTDLWIPSVGAKSNIVIDIVGYFSG